MHRDDDVKEFLRQDLEEISAEYKRLTRRSTEDPGTAGDQGELNWAKLLRDWLPSTYQVVTKGRIVAPDGQASPQVDLVILRPSYPPRLVDKKLYIASGVAAAFECKTTVTAADIRRAAGTAAQVHSLCAERSGNPRVELISPIFYGLLAQSHTWKRPASEPRRNVDKILKSDVQTSAHPADLIDIVCVADLDTWRKHVHIWPSPGRSFPIGDGEVSAYLLRTATTPGGDPAPNNPVAVLISTLVRRLAWDDVTARPMGEYFMHAALAPAMSSNIARTWAAGAVLTAGVNDQLAAGFRGGGWPWNEWEPMIWV